MKWIFLILIPGLLFANYLKVCFKAYYLIFPVGYSCLKVEELTKKEIKIEGITQSTFLGSIFKKIEITASSRASKNLISRKFYLKLTSGDYRKIHIYEFKKGFVKYEIIVEKQRTARIMKGKKNIKKPSDPLTATLFLFLNASPLRKKHFFFYDGREQLVEFMVIGEEELERLGMTWNTLKVKVIPRVRTTGILIPKGIWYVWIDKETRLPIRMKVSFTLGSANAWIDSIDGNLKFFYSLRESSLRNP